MNEYGYLPFDVCLLYIGCIIGTNVRHFWIFLELLNLTKYELLHRLLKRFNGCFLIMKSFKACWLNSSIADSSVKIYDVKVRWSDHSAKYHSCVFSCSRSTSTFMYSSLLFFNFFCLMCHYVFIDWCLKRWEKKIKNMTNVMNQIKHSTWRLCCKYERIWISAIWCMFVVYWMYYWDKCKTFLNIFGTFESY